MNPSTINEPKRKLTAIPRLNKKMSYDSRVMIANEYHDESVISRSTSDPNCQSRTSDQSFTNNRTKNLYRFTLNEHLIDNSKTEEADKSVNNEINEEASNMSGERSQCKAKNMAEVYDENVLNQNRSESCQSSPRRNVEFYSTDEDQATVNDEASVINSVTEQDHINNNVADIAGNEIPNTCCSIRNIDTLRQMSLSTTSHPYQQASQMELQNARHQIDEQELLRNRLLNRGSLDLKNQSLQDAYIQQRNFEKQKQLQALNQCRWNIINPLYKSLELKKAQQNLALNTRLVSDIDVSSLVQDDISDDIDDTDIEDNVRSNKNSPRLDETNCNIYKLYNISRNKELNKSENTQRNIENKSDQIKHESIVNAFLEVFDNDSHIIEKLKNKTPAKYDDRFRKIRDEYPRKDAKPSEVCVIQDSPRDTLDYESCKSKLVHDLYKNDDITSTITQSSNDRSIPDNISGLAKQIKRKPDVSIKDCACEIKHLQLNEVQKSIADIHCGMQMMLTAFSPIRNEDIALELTRIRTLYEECLLYQRKTAMQNQRLMNDIHNICCSVSKILESQHSGYPFRYLMLPVVGVLTYYVLTQFGLCKKIPICEQIDL